jgi:alpha-methylacyl-CoA racemase
LTIVEMAGLGPGPFAAMMLADHGAEVIRVERPGNLAVPKDPLTRSRRSLSLNLKSDEGASIVRRLAARADGLIEGYRPGVMERLGLGPDQILEANPKLVYGRVTGWGQDGPLAQEAGHDINYIAITGLLHGIGPKERPIVPGNYLGDYAGGGLMLAFGMVAALLAVQRGARGQVIDAAMSDGAALVGALTYGLRAAGHWRDERESNLLDGGEPAYGIYRCADGKFLSVGAVEPQFRRALFEGLGLAADAGREAIAKAVAKKSRDQWVAHFAGREACVAPVLSMGEAPAHLHNRARGTFVNVDGVLQPGPAPRYSTTTCEPPSAPGREGADTESILAELGFGAAEIAGLRKAGVVL